MNLGIFIVALAACALFLAASTLHSAWALLGALALLIVALALPPHRR